MMDQMRPILEAGLEKLGLDTGAVPALTEYARLLLETNQVMNLTAITDPKDVATLHFLDCASLLPLADFSGKTVADVDFFVFHQANARIIDLAAKKYHIPPEKYYKNIQKYGNTSAASIPLVISELHDLGKVGPGSRVLVVGFGGGLTWGGALVEFA